MSVKGHTFMCETLRDVDLYTARRKRDVIHFELCFRFYLDLNFFSFLFYAKLKKLYVAARFKKFV